MRSRWLRIGHRGASGSAPEHTASAFQRAVEAGVDMIELDVQLSRDGELVVMHDLSLERTSTGRGLVRERTLPELKQLDCGSWFGPEFAGEAILSLSEVIDLLPANVRLNVEIKALEEDWQLLAERLIALLERTDRLESTLISSFLFGALEQVRRGSDAAKIGLLTHDPQLAGIWEWAEKLHATSLHPFYAFVDVDAVSSAHEHGLQVIVWTVNDMGIARGLVALGVDGVISDFPESFGQIAVDSKE